MGPIFNDAAGFLNTAAHQLNNASLLYKGILERLSIEGRAARYGQQAPD